VAAYIARRLVIMVISLLGASVVAFFMLYLTGDPTNLLLPDDVLPEEREVPTSASICTMAWAMSV